LRDPDNANLAPPEGSSSLVAKLLRPFAVVKADEVVTAVIMTITVFLLLTAYYVLKTAREPLVLLEGGAEVKAYAAAGQSLLLVPVIAAYSAVARRVGRMKLLTSVYLFFVANLVLFALAARAELRIGIPFYLWVGVFNVMTIAQFWSFANDIYTPEQGKRLFAILGIGSSVGAVAGARIAHALVDWGTSALMLTSTLLLCICVVLLRVVNGREGAPALHREPVHDEPLETTHVWSELARDRYLLLIAALTLVLNWVNNNGEYLVDRTLLETAQAHAAEAHVTTAIFIGRFKSEYFSYYNVGGVLLQLFAVSRIMRVTGVRGALAFLPTLSLIGYAAVAIVPALRVVEMTKVVENSLDYSLQNTARQTLFLVTDRVEKYIGKTVIDTLMMRLGDVLAAASVALGTWLSFGTRVFALLNVVLVALWAGTLVLLGREYGARSETFADAEHASASAPVPA
jgi:AAA family ATP:ADP antiporter